ncbi:MAG: hypothetical protein M1837_003756 [Sclerophora amabilis]|nr:MAG: hypothetical protein M1837_003756 [Sclerophora amabilis]
MGIKGIYDEIGPGRRVALSKLAVEKFEETGRPLRIAIDLSIWQFQIQSGKGGANPALRTLYYRLVKLLSLSIQPLFVFDGPERPAFKRHRHINTNSTSILNSRIKQLLDLFGFPHYVAPGEAEAECALLQQEALVDAVLSEDVDALMFGCGLSLRNWSSEGTRGNKSPTHVSVYDANEISTGSKGLEKEDMILIAMMSGGDYIPEGIPGCGIKIAHEAAKAGFGKSLCKISSHDANALLEWKKGLAHELETNESKLFKSKHRAVRLPSSFPDATVLQFYTEPKTSSAEQLHTRNIQWHKDVDVVGLRTLVSEFFEWRHLSGAKKFIRGLAPALLVQTLRMRGQHGHAAIKEIETTKFEESALVKGISGIPGAPRKHFSTDGMEEIRIGYIPLDLVGLELEAERADSDHDGNSDATRDGDALSLQGSEVAAEGDAEVLPKSPSKRRSKHTYDPTAIELVWVLKTFVEIGIPLMFQDWKEPTHDARKYLAKKEANKRAMGKRKNTKETKAGGMVAGAMDRYVRIKKPVSGLDRYSQARKGTQHVSDDAPPPASEKPSIYTTSSINQGDVKRNKSSRARQPTTPQRMISSNATHVISLSSDGDSDDSQDTRAEVVSPWTLAKRPSASRICLPQDASCSHTGTIGPPISRDKAKSDDRSSRENGLFRSKSKGLVSPPSTPITKPTRHVEPLPLSSSESQRHDDSMRASKLMSKEQKQPGGSFTSTKKKLDLASTGGWVTPHEDQTPSQLPHCDPLRDSGSGLSPPLAVSLLTPDHPPVQVGIIQDADLSSSPYLPSLSSLTSASGQLLGQGGRSHSASPSPVKNPNSILSNTTARGKTIGTEKGRMIILRSSLEGSWREVDELEASSRSRVWKHDDVEVVDLASD